MKPLLFSFAFIAFHSLAQQRMIIYFSDNPAYERSSVSLSEKSENRRLNKSVQRDAFDRNINKSFLKEISMYGKVLNKSRWLNAVSFETHVDELQEIEKLPFIRKIQLVNEKIEYNPKDVEIKKTIDYGVGYEQVNQINIDCLHDLGYTGQGVLLGVIDAGFEGMDTIGFFNNVYQESRLVDQYNFVGNNTSVYHSSYHGTAVSSCIVGESTGGNPYVGTGFDVQLALYLAEDVFSETIIEEFNVVAALERCDSVGVDVVNISLGYFAFDDPNQNHVYADLDGNTTIAAVGVNIAVSKGIAVVMSAGNSGPSNISTPCDADDGLCVGAVDVMDNYAFFSSVGPNSDGQVKPDVAARGLDAWVVINDGSLVQGSGTSFSSPITAGAVACLVQADPTKSVSEIFQSIRMSANQFSTPDSLLGYGIPDFCLANQILNVESINIYPIEVYPNPASNNVSIVHQGSFSQGSYNLMSMDGKLVATGPLSGISTLIPLTALSNGIYNLIISLDHVTKNMKLEVSH